MQEEFRKKIEDTLHSIDGIEKASPNPFFFTRLEARMNREKNTWEKIASFVARPVVALACICLVIMINAVVVFSSSDAKDATASSTNNEIATVDEYSQVSVNFYEYENTKP
ncbi:MAG TPA: hypothetical protein VGW31_12400 [Hanamia sp.]|nr:hypothetical protein [Hanamia sp.]